MTGVRCILGSEGCPRAAHRRSQSAPAVAPVVWMGLAEHHAAFGASFSLSLSTYHRLLKELCGSILQAGFKKILIVNSRGGNVAALNAMTTDLAREPSAPIVPRRCTVCRTRAALTLKYWRIRRPCAMRAEAETSMMLASFADCVRSDRDNRSVRPDGHS